MDDTNRDVDANNSSDVNNAIDVVNISALYPKPSLTPSKKPETVVKSHFISRVDGKTFVNSSSLSSSLTSPTPISSLTSLPVALTVFSEVTVEKQDLSQTCDSLPFCSVHQMPSNPTVSFDRKEKGHADLVAPGMCANNATNRDIFDNSDIYNADLVHLTLLPAQTGELNNTSSDSLPSVILNIGILTPVRSTQVLSSQENEYPFSFEHCSAEAQMSITSQREVSNTNQQVNQTPCLITISNTPQLDALSTLDVSSISPTDHLSNAEAADATSTSRSTPEAIHSENEANGADDINGEEEELAPIVSYPLTASMEYQRTIFSFSSAYLFFWDIFFPPFSFEIIQSHHGPPFILFAPLEGEEEAE